MDKKSDLERFIREGLDAWEQVKIDFAGDNGLSDFLRKATPVVVLGHVQLAIDEALSHQSSNIDKAKADDQRHEISENGTITMEVRFSHLDIEFIQRVKQHPAIEKLNKPGPASIRVVIKMMSFLPLL